MKKTLFLFALLFLAALAATAQNRRITLTGDIIDTDTKSPVEQATVQLLSLPDSTFIAGVVSQQNGRFTLSAAKAGKYVLKVSFVGYQTVIKPVDLSSAKPTVNVGQILFAPDAIMLGEAVIVAEAPPVTVKEDTTVYAASAYRVAEGAMLEELVKKLPGAEVDKDGKITINGKEVKKIMVDGKEFFSDDPKVSMKNLPVNMVENVKAYDRKSDMARITGIDDGDEETVLDLTVKKGMKKGWIGNLIAGYGSEDRYEAGAMINRFLDDASFSAVGSMNNTNNTGFSEFGDAGQGLNSSGAGSGVTAAKSLGINFAKDAKKVQVGGNVQYGYSDNNARKKTSSETFLGEQSSYQNSLTSSKRGRHDLRGDFRLEWRPDTMTTIIFRPNGRYSKTNSINNGESETLNNSHNPVNEKTSNSNSKSDNYSFDGRLQVFRKLNNKGRNISLGVNFGYGNGETDSESYSNTLFSFYDEDNEWLRDSLSVIDRQTNRTSNNYNYRISASYTEPVFKNHFLQIRYEFSHKNSSSQSLVYDKDSVSNDNTSGFAENLSNKVENDYNTHNAELSLRGIYPKMMYSAGLGMTPQSSRSLTSLGPNSDKPSVTQKVLNFSPSVMFRYMFTKQHVLMLRYRGRSNEPNIEDLQEIIDNTNPLNIRYGNPDLKPSFNNNLMLFYNNYMPKSMRSYSVNLYFSNTMNSIANKLTYNLETGGQESKRVNVNGNWNTRAFITFNTPFRNKKYTISSNTNSSFSNSVSYTSVDKGKDSQLSNTRNFIAGERLNGNYRTDKFDISLNASVNYNLTRNNKQQNSNRETFDYYFGGSTNINFPWQVYLSTDANYHIKDGYSGGLDQNEFIWNAQLSKNFLKNNSATIRFKIYDILRQQSNLSRSISETKITDSEYNTLGSYFMVHFVYRLNTLGGKAPRSGKGGGYGRGEHGGGRRGDFGPPGGGSRRF